MNKVNEKEEKVGRTFNFVNSIKGGCGKTTFSIFLSRYLYTVDQRILEIQSKKKMAQQSDEEKAQDDRGKQNISENVVTHDKCLILDMDFQGTAMESLFYGATEDTISIKSLKETNKRKYLNQAIREGGEINDYIVHNTLNDEVVLDVIFADSAIKEKERFRIIPEMGYSPVVQYNVFRGGLLRFLKSFKDSEYQHFIFDMPPNSDGFSSAVMECVMDNNLQKTGNLLNTNKIREKDDVVNLFFICTLEPGQIKETIKEVVEQLKNRNKIYFDNLFIVLNDNIVRKKDADTEIDKNIKAMVSYLYLEISKVKLVQKEYERVYILRMVPYENYSTYFMIGNKLNIIKEKSDAENAKSESGDNIDTYIPIMSYNKIATADNRFEFIDADYENESDQKWLKEKMLKKKPEEKK